MKKYKAHASSISGISANIVALAPYAAGIVNSLLGMVAAVYIYRKEKYSGLVKFHSVQAIYFSIFRFALRLISLMGYFFAAFTGVLNVIGLALVAFAVVGIVKAYNWEIWKMPVLGEMSYEKSKESPVLYDGGDEVPPQARQEGYTEADVQNADVTSQTQEKEAETQLPKVTTAAETQQKTQSVHSNAPAVFTSKTYEYNVKETKDQSGNNKISWRNTEKNNYSDANYQLPKDMRDAPPSNRDE